MLDNLEDEEDLDYDDLDDNDLETTSFVCEDCDYRWEDASQDEADTGMMVCPMCGSTNVTQL